VGRAHVRRPVGEATGSDKFSGRIGQVLKWRKRTGNEIRQVAKTDQLCPTLPDRYGGGGPRLGWKNIREEAGPKSRKEFPN
jgi:hypothetical protein